MAKLTFDVAPSQLTRAQKLVDAGVYESLQQFCEIAFTNQLALEDGADPEDLAQQARARREGGAGGGGERLAARAPKNKKKRIPPLPPRAERVKAPPVTNGRDHDAGGGAAPAPSSFDAVVGKLTIREVAGVPALPPVAASPEQRILALVNKPFGFKLVVRAVLAHTSEGWPSVETLAETFGEDCAVLAREIVAEDRAAERTRNLLHTGLPTLDTPESMERFAVQYLGRVARSGQVTPGAAVQFALAALADGRMALSTAGAEFARLPNPVLDGGVRPWERLLAAPEQQFLVRHIVEFVPGEARDARAVVEAIHAGHDRPEALLAAVKPTLPPSWTDVQARSYLSGLVTRLSELDVLSRVWTGREVHYELATQATPLLERAAAREVA